MPPLSLHLGTRYVRVNRMFCSWVGVSSEQLVGKRKFQDLLSVGGRIFHQTHFAPLLAMQGSISEVKLELLQADGSGLPIVINAMVQQQDGVKVHDLAAYVARDRDKYERELILSRKRLEELVAETRRLHEHAKDRALFAEQMIGIVSHDLRNPVSTIQTGAALLSRGPAVPGHDRLVSRILRASQRADQNAASVWDCSSSVKLRARTAELPTSILRLKPARLSAPRSAALREGQGPIFAPARALFSNREQHPARRGGNLFFDTTARPTRVLAPW